MKTTGSILKFALLGVSLLAFCRVSMAQDVSYNFVPGTDFSKYKTYRWVDVPGGKHPNQILDGQIVQAIDSQLNAKGLAKTDGDTADLYVDYQVAVDKQQQWNSYSSGYGWYWGGMTTTSSSNIYVGTLVLDIYDAQAKRLIWRGDATKTLKPDRNQQKVVANIQKGIAKLLKNYPPRAK
ncbi:MAG: DUF4136 domain-containing protein [Blastocatellia bacterium]